MKLISSFKLSLSLSNEVYFDLFLCHEGSNDTWTSILTESMTQIDIMGNNFALSSERASVGYFSEKQVDMSAFLVQVSSYESTSYTWQDAFRFVEPFSGGVWLAMFVCMVVSALVVFVLDWSFYVERRVEKKSGSRHQIKEDNEVGKIFEMNGEIGENGKQTIDPLQTQHEDEVKNDNSSDDDDDGSDDGEAQPISLFDSFYLAFASFTGAESFAPVSKPSKIFVASWSMLILIIVATYTANLAATLTKSDSFVEEIQSVEDAIKLGAKTCVSTRNVYYPSLPTSYSNSDEISQLYPFLEVNGLWTDLYEYMKNGTCRVALFNREDITAALQNQDYCDLLVVSEHYMSGVYHWHYSRWQ
jgi:hypothetical protein